MSDPVKALAFFMAACSAFVGTGLLLVDVDERSLRIVSRIMPWARLCRYRWFRHLLVCLGLALSAWCLAWGAGWVG